MATTSASGSAKVQPKVDSAGTSWSTLLLDLLGAPHTAANYKFLNNWTHAEGPTVFDNNPFFTTAGGSGTVGAIKAGTFPLIPDSAFGPGRSNTAGIPAYPNIETGDFVTAYHIAAEYPAILAALKSGNPFATNPTEIHELNTWGTGAGAVLTGSQPSTPTGPVIHSTVGISSQGISGLSQAGIGGSILKAYENLPFTPTNPTGLGGSNNPLASGLKGLTNVSLSLAGLPQIPSNAFMRSGEILGGSMLILLGLIIIGTKLGSTSPAVQTRTAVGTAKGLVK